MKLLTKKIKKEIPALCKQDGAPEPIAYVKYFAPWGNWTWYGMEFDGKDTFFGYVVGHHREFGYFNLSDLKSAEGPWGLKIERDKYFEPTKVSEIKKLYK